MAKFLKLTKRKIFTIFLAVVLIIGGIAGYFIYKNNYNKTDFEMGMIVKNRVNKAQYLPNINLLVKNPQSMSLLSSSSDQFSYSDDLSFDLDDYQAIVDELAIVTGTAIRSDTNIMEIKEEIYTVLDMVPMFGQWFQLPEYLDPDIEPDGNNNFYYKLNYDKASEKISIIRMTWIYGCPIYSAYADRFYTHSDDDVEQFQIMEANYYYNSNGKEVVECSVVDFARFNIDFYPIQSQYLSNVQDTSTTKIQTIIRKEVEPYDSEGGINYALDLDNYREDGVMKKIVQLNYTDADNVELIKIEQNSNTQYYSDINTTNLAYYLKESENAIYFVDAWDYYDEENSFDEIELKNLFHVYGLSKESVIDSFTNSQFINRQAMGDCSTGSSSSSVCSQCYNKVLNSGLLVYKCNHNKNKEKVVRAVREIISTSETYQNEIYDLIPWNISKHLSKFAYALGVSDQIVSNYSSQFCKELNDEYQFENNLDKFLAEVSKDYLKNCSLVDKVGSIYNTIITESKRLRLNDLNKSAISTEIVMENFKETTTIFNNEINIFASATIKSSMFLEKNAQYSLGLVLYDNNRNINCTLLTNYMVYDGKDLSLTLNGKYNISNFSLKESDVQNISTELILGYTLLKKGEISDIVCSTYNSAKITLGTYSNFESQKNGFRCIYQPDIINKTLTINISFEDVEDPNVILNTLNNSDISLSSGSTVYDLLKLVDIIDNDLIRRVLIFHNDEKYIRMSESLIAGQNKIIVIDRTGNMATLIFNVILN